MKTNVGNHKNFALGFLDVIFSVKIQILNFKVFFRPKTQCLKINIASEASYIYMTGQKFIKKAKNG